MPGGQGLPFLLAKDLARREARELSDVQIAQPLSDRLPVHRIREDEREVAFDGLEAGELLGNGLTQRQAVEPIEIDLAHINALPELALLRLSRVELTEPGNGQAIGYGARRTPGVKPLGNDSYASGKGIEVEGAWSKLFQNFFDRSLEIKEVDGMRRPAPARSREIRTRPMRERDARRRAPHCH